MAQRSSSPGPLVHLRSLFSPEAEPYEDTSDPVVQDASADQSSRSRSDGPERTFHPFSRHPTELRLKIWEMTVEPRVVELRCIHNDDLPGPEHIKISSLTPPPATLQACRESRNHLLKTYSKVLLKNGGWKCVNPPMRGKRGWRKRTHQWEVTDETVQEYALLFWDIDTVCIGTCPLGCFESVAPLIKNLKLERDIGNESWRRWECDDLQAFQKVEKILVVYPLSERVRPWHVTPDVSMWPCDPENVFLMDQDQTLRATEVRDMRMEA